MNFHPKVWVVQIVLTILTAGAAALAAWTDDVSWKVPVGIFLTQVVAGLAGFITPGGVEGAKVDLAPLAPPEQLRAIAEATPYQATPKSATTFAASPSQPPG